MAPVDQAWLVLIEPQQVRVALWEGEQLFLSSWREWDGLHQEDLLAAVDAARGEVLSRQGGQSELKSVIFVLPSGWINSAGEILPSYKERLKFVSQELGWRPLGFLVKKEVLGRWGKQEAEFSSEEFFRYLTQLISQEEEQEEAEEQSVAEEKEEPTEKEELNFGFQLDDVAESLPKEEFSEPEPQEESSAVEPIEKEVSTKPKKKRRFNLKLPQLKNRLFKRRVVKFPKKPFIWLSLPLGVLGAILMLWFFSQVKLTIYLTPETVKAELEVQLDPQAEELSIDQGIVPIDQVSLVVKGEKSRSTTGEKLVGEKARGEVVIYNRTSQSRTFPAGTVLTGPGGLKFVLDEEVRVASKTPDLVSGVDRWGEAKAAVTAAKIGANYNLAAESVFLVDDLSRDQFLAKNQEAFTGGTSRQIRAVSKEDRDKLEQALREELIEQAKEELRSGEDRQGRLFFKGLKTKVRQRQFSAAVGDETEELRLNLELEVTVPQLAQEQLIKLAQSVLAQQIKPGFRLDSQSVTADLDSIEVSEEGVVQGQLRLSGRAYPQINRSELVSKLRGKKLSQAAEVIRSYPRVYRYQFEFRPSWFRWFGFLPLRQENISIELGG